MNELEQKRVHVNDCLSDKEIQEIADSEKGIMPGQWVVRNGRIEHFRGTPIDEPSLAYAAASRLVIPTLLRGVRALENALRDAWSEARSWRSEYTRERDNHQATARRGETQRRADYGLESIARLLALSADQPGQLHRAADLLQRWYGGEDIAPLLRHDIEVLEKQAAQRKKENDEILSIARKMAQQGMAIPSLASDDLG
jgi:hypothetical protein